ncbi:MAG: BatA domain-containing protein [Phycisphaerae bacterium]
MLSGLKFVAPLLLLGLLAALIPWLLHLLSSVRAQEVFFPTLRFLKLSMEKTARRRRIQHWLLLAVRTLLLAMLCLAVAQPITAALGGWMGYGRAAAVLLVDNSYSMAAREGQFSRFDKATAEAKALLGGEEKPAQAGLLLTNSGTVTPLTARLEDVRTDLGKTTIGYGPGALAERFSMAVEMLDKEKSLPRKAIYIFSDLQASSLARLVESPAGSFASHKDIHVFIINTGAKPVDNVGITDLEITGRRVVDSELRLMARLENSSPAGKRVHVGLRVDGQPVGNTTSQDLAASGTTASVAMVALPSYRPTKPGPVSGEVYIEEGDDLPIDNIRRFSLDIGGKVNALVVRGPRTADDPWWMDSGARVLVALQPFADKAPWPIVPTVIEAEQFAANDLAGVDAAFFSDVPSFTPEQASAITEFVRKGGTAVFFLGPSVQADNYNLRFAGDANALLPARLAGAVGEIGPAARADKLGWVDKDHPYLKDLWPSMADYLTSPVNVQRAFLFEPRKASLGDRGREDLTGTVLARLKDQSGPPLIVVRNVEAGRAVTIVTTSSPRWSNFSSQPLFMPLVVRMALLARKDLWRDNTYGADSKVTIRVASAPGAADDTAKAPPAQVPVKVTLPAADAEGNTAIETLAARKTPGGYEADFLKTGAPGLYRWTAGDGEMAGQFAVNPEGQEARLQPVSPDDLKAKLKDLGLDRVYIAPSVTEADVLAAKDAEGRNWWDVLAAVAVVLLVAEAVISNRRRAGEEAIPAHLNPKIAA